ncbi:MAG: ATP-dependent chaperone ClpB, partial [Candidatus Lokiarchaeota archaeon]|nr:ATP-dependent chaperone ClpB [Candidatus Lokiarchaeota archaeon]
NRIDEIIFFKPLLKSELKQIIDIQIENIKKILTDKNIQLEVNEDAKDFLFQIGYDVIFGARPLKRTIQKYLTNPLATELLMNKFSAGDTVLVCCPIGDKLEFKKQDIKS